MQIKIKKVAKSTKKYCKNHSRTVWFSGLGLFLALAILGISQFRAAQIEVQLAQKQLQYSTEIAQLKSIHTAKKLAAKSKTTQQTTNPTPTTPAPETPTASTAPNQPGSPNPTQTAAPKPAATPSQAAPPPTGPTPTPAAPPAPPTPTESSTSLTFINSLRSGVGKPALTGNATMNAWALAHAEAQATSCNIYHQSLSPFLGRNIGPTTLSGIAENVGYAPTVNAVLNGLKNSPGHYANMTGDYTYVGIGVVTAKSGSCAGYVYTTQMFGK